MNGTTGPGSSKIEPDAQMKEFTVKRAKHVSGNAAFDQSPAITKMITARTERRKRKAHVTTPHNPEAQNSYIYFLLTNSLYLITQTNEESLTNSGGTTLELRNWSAETGAGRWIHTAIVSQITKFVCFSVFMVFIICKLF